MSFNLPSIRRKIKRVGRGGKRGTSSGRGTKGQKSRSGHVIRPAERDMILKLPKRRGFRNKPKSIKNLVLNLHDVAAMVEADALSGRRITCDTLKEAGIIGKKFRGEIKILGNGEIKVPVTVSRDLVVSKAASEKITAAGGKIEQ